MSRTLGKLFYYLHFCFSGGSTSSFVNLAPERWINIQKYIILLLHSHNCARRDTENLSQNSPCEVLQCKTIKEVIRQTNNHTMHKGHKGCTPLCLASRQIINHWNSCIRLHCPICTPLNGIAINLSSSQVTAYPVNCTNGWHNEITNEQRSNIVFKFARIVTPLPGVDIIFSRRTQSILTHIKSIERDIFITANCKQQYYRSVAERIHRIRMESVLRRQNRGNQ